MLCAARAEGEVNYASLYHAAGLMTSSCALLPVRPLLAWRGPFDPLG